MDGASGAAASTTGGTAGRGGTGDSSGTGGTGGAGGSGGSGGACNEFPDTAPPAVSGCPGNGTTCPDCTGMNGLGGPVADGTYLMTIMHVWSSGCGGVESIPARAALEIHDGVMQLVYTGPRNFGGDPPTTTRGTFTFSPGHLGSTLHPTCPDGGDISGLTYTSQGDTLIVANLPGMFELGPCMATFKLQP